VAHANFKKKGEKKVAHATFIDLSRIAHSCRAQQVCASLHQKKKSLCVSIPKAIPLPKKLERENPKSWTNQPKPLVCRRNQRHTAAAPAPPLLEASGSRGEGGRPVVLRPLASDGVGRRQVVAVAPGRPLR
uniref:Uncharacterized protein n=1 Tax=Aegilops tauschii subsp. strangulata TaxID=200361 RepID=A0A453M582_AEGTS